VDTIQAMARALEKRDPYTAGHQQRVAELAAAIATEMDLDADRVEGIRLGGMIHDIGKIYVPAEILNRPGKLTPAEFEIIKSHPQVGYEIIKDVVFPWPVAEMVSQHHERLDGSGYPNGLMGEAIAYDLLQNRGTKGVAILDIDLDYFNLTKNPGKRCVNSLPEFRQIT